MWTNHMDHEEDSSWGTGRARRLVWTLKYITCVCEPGGLHGSLLCNHRYPSMEPRSLLPETRKQFSLRVFHKVPEERWLLSDSQKSLCGQFKHSHMD